MTTDADSALISTAALAARLGQPGLSILDASWHMPAEKRDAHAEFVAEHIPGAVFFDIDAISDTASSYPHMLPTPEVFSRCVSLLGIGNGDDIIVYDTSGLFSATRVWWMFRAFGHDKVYVLDGGLPRWKMEGKAVESGEASPHPTLFHAHFRPQLLLDRYQVKTNIHSRARLLLDARSPGRFQGIEAEPRPGLRSGHIEGSANVFFKDCLTGNGLKSRAELKTMFAEKGIDAGQKLAATCGSGVTACILTLALFELGNRDVPVYDGAWAEWGSQPQALTK